jgi:hypothetical protein
MPIEVARAGLLIGAFILIPSVPLLLFGTPGTAEYTVTQFTVIIGLVFTLAIVLAARLANRR